MTAMSREEFAKGPAVILDMCWPGHFDELMEAAYWQMLRDIELSTIEQALVQLRSRKYRPSVAEIVAHCGESDRELRLRTQHAWCIERYGLEKANELFPMLTKALASQ